MFCIIIIFFLYLPGNSSVFQKSTAGQPSVRVLGQVRVQIRHKFERLVHARESRVRISGSTSSVGVNVSQQVQLTRSNPSQLGQHSQTESTELTRSVQLSGSTFRRNDLEYCRMHASKPRLGNDIIEVVIS
ncbi:hypothetical protein HanHA300_Chr15g0584591 [Helianthus annuus]|nr:hypothetical protein HanHA300_Chr15g0584591 [Helianthus annuus]KAJ0503798.1 hypothetical protein HanHA89_Chr12g0452361 [Helianthus annuus]KAJ0503800.1 hypothetical protein HanHA89_Chr12g0452381 [Helianthus annuus]KAJ0676835.1 hypothetical protein HanOQP8_Chr12g0430391 [Helianthus annuus]